MRFIKKQAKGNGNVKGKGDGGIIFDNGKGDGWIIFKAVKFGTMAINKNQAAKGVCYAKTNTDVN